MKPQTETTDTGITRRHCLATASAALLGAAAITAPATESLARNRDEGEVLYGHGTVWNRDLPGMAADLNLSFDLRVNLASGVGGGSAYDPVYPDWNIHFAISSTERTKLRGGESQFVMRGVVTHAVAPDMIGLPLGILAQTQGDATAIAIVVDEMVFGGAGVVTIEYLFIATIVALGAVLR